MSSLHVLANDSLICHAFNHDQTKLAISVNTNDVYLLRIVGGNKFEVLDVLKEHTAVVMGLDWAHKTNKIVSCSADRNAYVWTEMQDKTWKPTLVVLMFERAAICVRWSPLEDLFAVGSGSKVVAVCYFDEQLDWWASKRLKKQIKSTVTCLDWHPNNSVLACGSSDYHLRVYAAHVNSGEKQSAWGNHSSLGNVLFEHYESEGGWVLGVCFSADGNKLVWSKQNSLIFVADVSGAAGSAPSSIKSGPAVVSCLRTDSLPFISTLWVGTSTFILAGYDCCPMAFRYTPDKGIQFVHAVDVKGESKSTGKVSAMRKFQDFDRMATVDNSSSRLTTVHQNCINELRLVKGSRSKADTISSVGRDGCLVFWNLSSLCQQIANLSIS